MRLKRAIPEIQGLQAGAMMAHVPWTSSGFDEFNRHCICFFSLEWYFYRLL
ncbi:MAG: hypothetical protein JXA20_17340 [Spirochaetes bacterium]|nr:hypothetical protein [Spirochaetota bacterium]